MDCKKLRVLLQHIRQQPMDSLALLNVLDTCFMQKMGTYPIILLWQQAIRDVDIALQVVDSFERGMITSLELKELIQEAAVNFKEKSVQLEKMITQKVSFALQIMILFALCAAVWNTLLIFLLSRSLSQVVVLLTSMLQQRSQTLDDGASMNLNLNPEFKDLFVLIKKNLEQQTSVEQQTEKLESLVRNRTESLHRVSQDIRGLLDNSRNFIGLMSMEGVLLDANRTALQAAGMPASEILNKPFWETPWWSHSEQLRIRLKQAIACATAGKRDGFEATHPSPGGGVIHVDFTLSPIFDHDRRVVGMIPEGINVTKSKLREQQMRRVSRELQVANEELKRSNADLQDFAYVSSHDLRSPLRGIDNLAKWIGEDCEGILPEASQRDLYQLRGRVRRMDALLNGLLEYSLAGQVDQEKKTVHLQQVLWDTVELLDRPRCFRIQISAPNLCVETKVTPLQTVVRNLVSNAIKHRSADAGLVKVEVQVKVNVLRFIICDDGPGIPKSQQETIFGLFKTIKTKDEKEASGLGLAIVKRLIEKEGFRILVTNNTGGGATFSYDWPFKI
ncbi:MAG: PAS domain-containing sensor histidine kinase [Zetaproteobacteria bacterium]|nr:PAS domain-containing sensor histidine kinase [Zetaproteobacteria bacterium]